VSARQHPYDLVFSTEELESRLAGITGEAEERDVDPRDPDRATMLVRFGETVGALLPEGTNPEAIQQVAWLVFHCYHFQQAGKHTFDLEEDVLRELLSTGFVAGPREIDPKIPSGYVRLPRHRVWSRITEDAQAEAIDGFFFVDHYVLFVLGLMPGRPGFSIMALTGPTHDEAVTSLVTMQARTEGEDFSNVLPGGELQGHFAVTNNAEALKLAARILWHLNRRG
jgi:hypothetical protein